MKKKEFDQIIKQNLEQESGKELFGYGNYDLYYTKEEFSRFQQEMKTCYPDAFLQYGAGKGGELKAQNGRYGEMPPKMACVASSSRFCYLALREGADALTDSGTVVFEYGCPIKGVPGNAPQLDAYLPETRVFVEAKCHEIFDPHKIILKEKYWDLIYGKGNLFGFPPKAKTTAEIFELSPEVFGIEKEKTMFDIKQFLCHLMGIASQKDPEVSATLLYLFYKPKTERKEDQDAIEDIFLELKQEIDALSQSAPILTYTQRNNISLKAVAEYDTVMKKLTKENLQVIAD